MYRHCALRMAPRAAAAPISRFLVEPAEGRTFDKTLEQCQADKTDMAAQLSSEFLHLQAKLVPYRIARLKDEVQFIAKHPFGSFPSFSNLIKHCILLPIVFILCFYAGRLSMNPLVAPPAPPAEAAPAVVAEADTKAKV